MTLEQLNENAKRLERAIKKDSENKAQYIKDFAQSFQSLELSIDGKQLVLLCEMDRAMLF